MPACVATMLHVPADTSVRVPPLTVQTPGVFEPNCTGRPELAMAESTDGVLPMVWVPGEAKLMVCAKGAGATVTVRVTGLAAM